MSIVTSQNILKKEYKKENTSINTASLITKDEGKASPLETAFNNIKNSYADSAALAYKNIKSNLDSIKDVSDLGSLGFTKIDINMDFINNYSLDLSKTKLIRVPNDNVNMLKNIKVN